MIILSVRTKIPYSSMYSLDIENIPISFALLQMQYSLKKIKNHPSLSKFGQNMW